MQNAFKTGIILCGALGLMACWGADQSSAKNAEQAGATSSAEQALREVRKLAQIAGTHRGQMQLEMQQKSRGFGDDKEAALKWRSGGVQKWRSENFQPIFNADFDTLYAFGLNNLDNKAGFDAFVLALQISEMRADFRKIQDIQEQLYEHYLNTPEYGYVLSKMLYGAGVGHDYSVMAKLGRKEGEAVMRARILKLFGRAAEHATDLHVQSHAKMVLAEYLGNTIPNLDPLDLDEINKRRDRAEALLRSVIQKTKKSDLNFLSTSDIEILNIYKNAVDTLSPPRPLPEGFVLPTREPEILHDRAQALLIAIGGVSVGRPLPPTIGQDLDGKPQDINQYKGRVLLIDFWATWCGPCIAKFPHFRELKEQYAGRPFEILGISADDNVGIVKDFLQDNEVTWDMWFSGRDGGVRREWRAYGLPELFLIDHKGVMVVAHPTTEKLDEMLGKLVADAEREAAQK